MSKERKGHNSKSIKERGQYFNSVIRPPGPTSEDDVPIIDTTDSPLIVKRRETSTFTPTRPSSRLWEDFQENIWKISIALSSLILGAISWLGIQIFSLNREVGEIRTIQQNTQTKQTDLESQVDKMEGRLTNHIGDLSSNLNRLELRVDEIVSRDLKKGDRSNQERQK